MGGMVCALACPHVIFTLPCKLASSLADLHGSVLHRYRVVPLRFIAGFNLAIILCAAVPTSRCWCSTLVNDTFNALYTSEHSLTLR